MAKDLDSMPQRVVSKKQSTPERGTSSLQQGSGGVGEVRSKSKAKAKAKSKAKAIRLRLRLKAKANINSHASPHGVGSADFHCSVPQSRRRWNEALR